MNKAIKAMKYAGVTLADFRKLDRLGRMRLWIMVVATIEWS